MSGSSNSYEYYSVEVEIEEDEEEEAVRELPPTPAPKSESAYTPPVTQEDDPLVALPDAVPEEFFAFSLEAVIEGIPETTCGTPGCMLHVTDVVRYLVPLLVQLCESRAVVMIAEEDQAPVHTRHSSSLSDEEGNAEDDEDEWCACDDSASGSYTYGSSASSDPATDKRPTARLRNISVRCKENISDTFQALIEILICKVCWSADQKLEEFDVSAITSYPWYKTISERGKKAYRTMIRFILFSLADKYLEVACLMYSGCCRSQRGGETARQFVSGFRSAVSALVKDFEMFSTDTDNMEPVMALCVDTLHELYNRGSLKDCIASKVCSRQSQHSNTEEVVVPGVVWPMHPKNARFKDLSEQEKRGLSIQEIAAAPTADGGHKWKDT